MKVSPEARRLAKYKEKKKEISVATLQFDVTFCTSILCAPSYPRWQPFKTLQMKSPPKPYVGTY